ncbi:Uu.00g113150.m01.CDS01 [Anthostomella pinea]|uniref:Uu.00g113150.m01.CDS01 n=1 Tax=Anthostomella pinea TaxID=933095 RepID=A0AAI8VFX5_9PEZI|nr:Uu.00g113150.m01.CDS01 [Anthostomella pinea]
MAVPWSNTGHPEGFPDSLSILLAREQEAIDIDPYSSWIDRGKGQAPDLFQALGCPVQGTIAQIKPNDTTPECPIMLKNEDASFTGHPCAVNVTEAAASSMSSSVASLATPSPTTTGSAGSTATPSSAAVPSDPNTWSFVLAACIFGGMAWA